MDKNAHHPHRVRPVFASDTGFYADLKDCVERYLQVTKQSRSGGMVGKAAVFLVWFSGSYLIFLASDDALIRILSAVSLGLAAAGLGFNVFHDSNHGGFGITAHANRAIAIGCSVLLGPSRFMWIQKHHVFHHRFTNLHKWDDDIETRGILRMAQDQPHKPWHRFQALYWPGVYALSTLEWLFIKDFKQYLTGKLNPYLTLPRMSLAQHLEFWLSKLAYVLAFVVLPVLMLGLWPAMVGLMVFHVTFGLFLTSVFQLAHMNDMASHPALNEDQLSVEDEWALHQLRTTVNFAPDNALATWYFGGLNYQIEHHLFPGMSHCRYADISPIVEQAVHARGITYNVYPTWRAALLAHIRSIAHFAKPTAESTIPDVGVKE